MTVTVRGDAFRLFFATSFGYALAILLAPVLSRLYSPSEFGAYTLFGAIAFCDAVACLGYDRAIAIVRDDQTARHLGAVALLSAAIVALVSGIFAFVFRELTLAPGWLLWAVPTYVFLYGVLLTLTGIALRARHVTGMAASRFTQASTVPLAQVALGLGPKGALSLVIGQFIGQFTGAIALMAVHRGARQFSIDVVCARCALSSNSHFPKMWAPATLLNSLNLQLPLIGVAALFGVHVAGLYGFGLRIVGAGVGIISSAVSQALFTHAAASMRAKQDLDVVRRQVLSVMRGQAVLAAPLIIVLLAAPVWVEMIFGSNWRASGVFFQLMAVPFAVQLCVSPVHAAIDALQQPKLHLKREMFRTTITVLVFSVPLVTNASVEVVLALYAVGVCSSYAYGAWLIMSALEVASEASP